MNRCKPGLIVIATAALLVLPAAVGQDLARASTDDLAGLQRWLDGTRDLHARFEQELLSGALGVGEVERGRLTLVRPGRMRWDYERPERKVALIDGERTRLWIEADRQLWEGGLDEGAGLLPALLSGTRPLADVFDVSALDPDPDGRIGLRLEPRSSAESFAEVVVWLRSADHSIEEAAVLDSAGNRVLYRFTRLRRNRGVDPDAFEFEPPPGTDVIAQP